MASGNSGMMGDVDARGLALTKDNAPTTIIADNANSKARTTGTADFILSSSLSLDELWRSLLVYNLHAKRPFEFAEKPRIDESKCTQSRMHV